MIQINTYISLPISKGKRILNCSEIGGNSSVEYKGLLAYFLGTSIPMKGQGHKIYLAENQGVAGSIPVGRTIYRGLV